MSWIWTLVVIIGPIALLAAIFFAWNRNRHGSRSDVRQAERGARDLREDLERRGE